MKIQFFLSFLCLIVAVSGKCLDDQQSLLIQLKNNLTLDPNHSTKLVNWSTNLDCCNWDGVKCDSKGEIIGLDLSNQSISGEISDSSSLFSFRYLKSLNLGFNRFNSTISSRFGNLTSLNYLNLSNAGFAGQIPIQISNLVNLVILDFSTVYFPGAISLKLENPNLETFISNFTALTQLYLDGINISMPGNQWCQAISSSLPSLEVLSLPSCYLSGPIDSSILKLQSSLSVVRLDKNNLSSPVPEFLANFSNLTSLGLSSCHLNGVFPEQIFQVSTLRILDVSDNVYLVGSLPEFPQDGLLQTVVLKLTNFSGTLPDSIGNLKMLSRLELQDCQFHGSLPSSMANLTNLVYLNMAANGFSGLIPSFSRAKNLAHIDLSHNNLNGSILATHWEGLMNLVYVDLRYNSLEGTIPLALFELPSLEQLQLSSNRLDGQLREFANASSSLLNTLDLGGNNLQGSIPNSIFELRKLTVLLLSSNRFNGTVNLDVIRNLGDLTKLEFSYNKLSVNASGSNGSNSSLSSFPQLSTLKLGSCNLRVFPDLKDQKKLNYLDLSDNNLRGEVPNWIWNIGLVSLNLSRNFLVGLQEPYSFAKLTILDLHLNNIRGEIPIPPATAAYVDYSSNNFSSFIPPDIGENLRVALFFSLSNNSLTGGIPLSICNATYLEVLDFSNNNLSGGIPSCLIEMSRALVVLNLRGNSLTGSIPDTFQPGCNLRTLDLNGNSLEGIVPQNLDNCTDLEVLDLGNNQIKDTYPCHLKSITSLRVLVLRNNKFYQVLGCPVKNVSWPNLQIIDLAFNNFSGAIPDACVKNWKAMMADEDGVQSKLKHIQFAVLGLTQLYYQDTVTVTSKGLDMELVKILTVFTSVDFSSNQISGPVPESFGELKALYVLNLSHNALTDQIPSSLGNLQQLESLDLSRNKLVGEIPMQLAGLTFLSFLNLSFNDLHGQIPTSTQLQSFSEASYMGNKGLCGPPLTTNCQNPPGEDASVLLKSQSTEFEWQFIFTGLGFGVGSGIVVAPLTFWSRGRKWCDKRIDQMLMVIFPMLGLIYMGYENVLAQGEGENSEQKGTHITDESDETEDKQGRYCIYCSKLNLNWTRVIHDPKCTCYQSPPISFSSSSSSSLLSS